MSRSIPARRPAKLSFPRVSGDEPTLADGRIALWAFSPRERG